MGILKVCEINKSDIGFVMERDEPGQGNGCQVFCVTQSHFKDFSFIIRLDDVSFEQIETEHNPKNFIKEHASS